MELEAFKIQVLGFRGKLYRFAKTLLKNDLSSEDVVQDVCLKLWNMREKLDSYQSVEALAMRMVKNHCLDQMKRKATNGCRLRKVQKCFRRSSRRTEKRN